jgi:hypothetical protein
MGDENESKSEQTSPQLGAGAALVALGLGYIGSRARKKLAKRGAQNTGYFGVSQPQQYAAGVTPVSAPMQPADMPWVDEQIARIGADIAVGAAPENPPPPLPRRNAQATLGPELTRFASDCFTICWAFFCMGERLVDAPNLADQTMRNRFAAFFAAEGPFLDQNSRQLVAATPQLWDSIRDTWQGADPFQRRAIRSYYRPIFMWFQDALTTWEAMTRR